MFFFWASMVMGLAAIVSFFVGAIGPGLALLVIAFLFGCMVDVTT